MAQIRQKLAKVYIHSQDNGNDFGIIDHLAEVGYDVDFEVVDNGVGNKVISCEIYDAGAYGSPNSFIDAKIRQPKITASKHCPDRKLENALFDSLPTRTIYFATRSGKKATNTFFTCIDNFSF